MLSWIQEQSNRLTVDQYLVIRRPDHSVVLADHQGRLLRGEYYTDGDRASIMRPTKRDSDAEVVNHEDLDDSIGSIEDLLETVYGLYLVDDDWKDSDEADVSYLVAGIIS
jgi:hypothetical protein